MRSIRSIVDFSLIAMASANTLHIKFRRGCSVIGKRLSGGDGVFGRGFGYLLASFCGVGGRCVFSDLVPERRRYERGCNAAKAPNHPWGGNDAEGASFSAGFGDVLGIKVSSSRHGPNTCATMLLNQSKKFLMVQHCSVHRGGGNEIDVETAVAPKVACLLSGVRILLTSDPKDPIVPPWSPLLQNAILPQLDNSRSITNP